MDRRRFLLTSVATATATSRAFAAPTNDNWAKYFTNNSAQGTLVIADVRGGKEAIQVHNKDGAAKRLSPASTFKIPHSMIALDSGVLRDEFQIVPWDGITRPIEAWNRDQDLRSAVRNSAVWVFERFAREIGSEKEAAYMRSFSYGNALSTGAEPFWVDGNLAISAHEQITFLRRLYNNTLPFRAEHQLIVKDVLINEADRDWILRAKSGWSGEIGWWVGWVEWPDGPVFFALNIDTPGKLGDLPKREKIVREVLRSIDALPG